MTTTYLDLTQKQIQIDEDGIYYYLFVGSNSDKLDRTIDFIHANQNIHAQIKIKAILFDSSRFDLKANMRINKGAKNTDSYLKVDVLLMSENASANITPGLEVLEDDVKGGHGATIGAVDENQLKYLMSRGINRKDAEGIIAQGFISEFLSVYNKDNMPEELQMQIDKIATISK